MTNPFNNWPVGTAVSDAKETPCLSCGGTGNAASPIRFESAAAYVKCERCNGTGKYVTVEVSMGPWEFDPDKHPAFRTLAPKQLKTMTPIGATYDFVVTDDPPPEEVVSWEEFQKRADAAGAFTVLPDGTKCYGLTNYPARNAKPADPEPDVVDFLCELVGVPRSVFEGARSASEAYERWAKAREEKWNRMLDETMEGYWRGAFPSIILSFEGETPKDPEPDVIAGGE